MEELIEKIKTCELPVKEIIVKRLNAKKDGYYSTKLKIRKSKKQLLKNLVEEYFNKYLDEYVDEEFLKLTRKKRQEVLFNDFKSKIDKIELSDAIINKIARDSLINNDCYEPLNASE